MLWKNARRDPEMLSVQDTAAEMLGTEQLWHIVAFKLTYFKMIGSFEYLKIVAEMRSLELDLGSFFDSFALMFIFD